MGKKKDKFINSSKAVIIKLGSRDIQDPNRKFENDNKPIYEIISYPDEARLTEEEKIRRDRILNAFDDVDRGIYDPSQSTDNNFFSGSSEALQMVEGKKGLWIHQLQKMKQEQMKNQLLESGEYDDVEIEEGDEEFEDIEEGEEYEDDDDEEEYQNKKSKKFVSLKEFQQKQEMKPEDKFGFDQIDYTKIKLNPSIKMKKLNEHGLPADDGYDYQQHIFNNVRPEGDLIATLNVNEKAPVCKPDIDYQVGEMTVEQKEVFASLQNENEYEDLEDDFVKLAQEGEECIIDENAKDLQCQLPTRKDSDTIRQQEYEQQQYEQHQKEKQKYQSQQNEQAEEKYDGDDNLEDEEFDEEEFKRAMEMYDECEQEDAGEQNKMLNQNEINDILDSHISEMQQRQEGTTKQKGVKFDESQNTQHSDLPGILDKLKQKQEEEEFIRNGGVKPDQITMEQLYQYNYKRRMRAEREIKIVDRGAIKQGQVDKYGDQVLLKQHVAPLDVEEDIALATYVNKDEETEQKEEQQLDKHFEKLIEPRQLNETIATKTFNMSTVHEHLNVVDESVHKQRKTDQSKIEENQEGEDEEDDMEIIKDVSSIFGKRNKEESEDERKLRKKLVKEFNKQRKENKRQFKNDFNKLSNAQKNKLVKQTQTSCNVRGVTVTKI